MLTIKKIKKRGGKKIKRMKRATKRKILQQEWIKNFFSDTSFGSQRKRTLNRPRNLVNRNKGAESCKESKSKKENTIGDAYSGRNEIMTPESFTIEADSKYCYHKRFHTRI